MSPIILDNLPTGLYEALRRRAEQGNRSLSDEAADILAKAMAENPPAPRREMEVFLSQEISVPFDLPRPEPLRYVKAVPGGKRHVDTLEDRAAMYAVPRWTRCWRKATSSTAARCSPCVRHRA